MKALRAVLLGVLIGFGMAACGEEASVAQLPSPREPGPEAIGYFCGMAVAEHLGPKGQVFLKDRAEPLWFSSVRDALAFTMLPGEPREIAALYVNDMSRSADWRQPQPGAWILARDALYVAGSDMVGGMGAREVVPFADRATAERFRDAHGGEIYGFDAVPEDLVLGVDGLAEAAPRPVREEGKADDRHTTH